MKMAILGRGKTGSKMAKICEKEDLSYTVFHSQNPPTVEALKLHDCIISFFPGPVLEKYLPLIKQAKVSIVSGSTGIDWPEKLHHQMKENKMVWIQGNNFSLGMNLVHRIIKLMHEAPRLLGENSGGNAEGLKAHIHEIHHKEKRDAPSGTALRWAKWLDLPQYQEEITSERLGDTIGLHSLALKAQYETITLTHEVHNRKVFAQGALWAAKKIIHNEIKPGYHWFEDIVLKELL